MVTNTTCLDSKTRWKEIIAGTDNPRHRHMLEIGLKHWWAEVVYDIDTIMETITPDISYRLYGTNALGPGRHIDTAAQARAMYLAQFAAGLMPGGPIDNHCLACGDWGYSAHGVYTLAMPGAGLFLPEEEIDPDQLYLFQTHMSVVVPFKGDLMAGEILYMSAPFNVEPTDHATIAHLLGWDPQSYV